MNFIVISEFNFSKRYTKYVFVQNKQFIRRAATFLVLPGSVGLFFLDVFLDPCRPWYVSTGFLIKTEM